MMHIAYKITQILTQLSICESVCSFVCLSVNFEFIEMLTHLKTPKNISLRHWILPHNHIKTHLFFQIFGRRVTPEVDDSLTRSYSMTVRPFEDQPHGLGRK